MNLHSTIGGDLVKIIGVNDIAVQRRLAYSWITSPLASSTKVAEQVIEGLADACKHNGCALIGGETANVGF